MLGLEAEVGPFHVVLHESPEPFETVHVQVENVWRIAELKLFIGRWTSISLELVGMFTRDDRKGKPSVRGTMKAVQVLDLRMG